MVSLRGGASNSVTYDLAKVDERWGLRPDQMLDYKALKGDPTDNIPGIPGVGEKTAAKLIATWGTLDSLYQNLDQVAPVKLQPLLAEHREQVLESRELMRLVRDVDVVFDPERGRVGDYDREAVVRLFREFEFRTLIDRLPPLLGERPEDAIARLREARQGTAAANAANARGGGAAAQASQADPGAALQLSLDFDVGVHRRCPRQHRRRLARGRGPCRGARVRDRRPGWRAGGGDRRPEQDRAWSGWTAWPRWSHGCAGWPRSASRSSPTIRDRWPASRSRSPSRATTGGWSPPTGRMRRSRCGGWSRRSARRSWGTR